MTVLLDFASFLCTTTNNSLWWAGLLNCVDFVSPAQPRRPILFSKQQMLLRILFRRPSLVVLYSLASSRCC
jgi:hypothetical protein